VIFTGGDPLKRPDLMPLVRAAVARGLGVSVAPSATIGLTHDIVGALKEAGVSAMSLSLDGPTAAQHDALRGVLGCFGWTLAAARRIVAAGIPLQINTLVTAHTEPLLEDTVKLVAGLGAARWSLFFLVAVGRGRVLTSLDPVAAERRLRWVAANARTWPFVASTTEAPHYRRIVIQQTRAAGGGGAEIAAAGRGWGIRDGNGIMFIAANGDVTPSGFLPLVAGNVRDASPLDVYRDSPIFRGLRDLDRLGGRCGACEFRAVCGGSRARAWAATGDPFAEDPLCEWRAEGVPVA
jgi:radical SAM protein with 4Fe4S-binding SPASM domain